MILTARAERLRAQHVDRNVEPGGVGAGVGGGVGGAPGTGVGLGVTAGVGELLGDAGVGAWPEWAA